MALSIDRIAIDTRVELLIEAYIRGYEGIEESRKSATQFG